MIVYTIMGSYSMAYYGRCPAVTWCQLPCQHAVCLLTCAMILDMTQVEGEAGLHMLAGAPPEGGGNQLVHRVDLDGDHPLLGNALQSWVLVQDAHVALGLSLCYSCHVVLAHTLILHLQAKHTASRLLHHANIGGFGVSQLCMQCTRMPTVLQLKDSRLAVVPLESCMVAPDLLSQSLLRRHLVLHCKADDGSTWGMQRTETEAVRDNIPSIAADCIPKGTCCCGLLYSVQQGMYTARPTGNIWHILLHQPMAPDESVRM